MLRLITIAFILITLTVVPVLQGSAQESEQQEGETQPTDDPSWQMGDKIEQANEELDALAKEIATLLAQPGFRGQVRSALAQSKNREQILELEDFLAKASGQKDAPPGLEKLKENTGKAKGRVRGLGVWDMEGFDLYFPVNEHLKKWKGNDDLFVAYSPYNDEREVVSIFAYSVKTGERYALDPELPIDVPVLVLAPEEHWTHEIVEAPATEGPPPTGPPTQKRDNKPRKMTKDKGGNSALVFQWIYLNDDREPSSKGAPEIYVFYADANKNPMPWGNPYLQHSIPLGDPPDTWWTKYIGAGSESIIALPWVSRAKAWFPMPLVYNIHEACTNEGQLIVMEWDGGYRMNRVATNYETGTRLWFPCRTGDDYVDGMLLLKSDYDYNQLEEEWTQWMGVRLIKTE